MVAKVGKVWVWACVEKVDLGKGQFDVRHLGTRGRELMWVVEVVCKVEGLTMIVVG